MGLFLCKAAAAAGVLAKLMNTEIIFLVNTQDSNL